MTRIFKKKMPKRGNLTKGLKGKLKNTDVLWRGLGSKG